MVRKVIPSGTGWLGPVAQAWPTPAGSRAKLAGPYDDRLRKTLGRGPMNTRVIAIAALVIVVILVIFLFAR